MDYSDFRFQKQNRHIINDKQLKHIIDSLFKLICIETKRLKQFIISYQIIRNFQCYSHLYLIAEIQYKKFSRLILNYILSIKILQSFQVGIKIKLNYKPTETEMRESGHQQKQVDQIKQNTWDDLCKFVTMHSKKFFLLINYMKSYKYCLEYKRSLLNKKYIDTISFQSLYHQKESHIIKNINDTKLFVFIWNVRIDDVNRSTIKIRGQKRK
ncbi:unnamed protein product [Paramecium pentaurelia]|uniref:Uncharacterized protein n=1 Tax=Paramecium pentaurelia TaxID=43138 RepID=A0A8S1VSD1_9CILI|nr:unnamed protein product [Paramecium pentaurelia]